MLNLFYMLWGLILHFIRHLSCRQTRRSDDCYACWEVITRKMQRAHHDAHVVWMRWQVQEDSCLSGRRRIRLSACSGVRKQIPAEIIILNPLTVIKLNRGSWEPYLHHVLIHNVQLWNWSFVGLVLLHVIQGGNIPATQKENCFISSSDASLVVLLIWKEITPKF